jgi:hypothetical protein
MANASMLNVSHGSPGSFGQSPQFGGGFGSPFGGGMGSPFYGGGFGSPGGMRGFQGELAQPAPAVMPSTPMQDTFELKPEQEAQLRQRQQQMMLQPGLPSADLDSMGWNSETGNFNRPPPPQPQFQNPFQPQFQNPFQFQQQFRPQFQPQFQQQFQNPFQFQQQFQPQFQQQMNPYVNQSYFQNQMMPAVQPQFGRQFSTPESKSAVNNLMHVVQPQSPFFRRQFQPQSEQQRQQPMFKQGGSVDDGIASLLKK